MLISVIKIFCYRRFAVFIHANFKLRSGLMVSGKTKLDYDATLKMASWNLNEFGRGGKGWRRSPGKVLGRLVLVRVASQRRRRTPTAMTLAQKARAIPSESRTLFI